MSPEVLLQVLETGLTPAVKAAGGELHIATDPDHIVQLLSATAPRTFRAILAYAGETAEQSDEAPGIRDCRFNLITQAARGLQIRPGRRSFRPTPSGRDSLLHISDDLDRIMRGFAGTAPSDLDCRGFRFLSRDWLDIEGQATRQLLAIYAIRLGSDKPQPTDQITLTFPSVS